MRNVTMLMEMMERDLQDGQLTGDGLACDDIIQRLQRYGDGD